MLCGSGKRDLVEKNTLTRGAISVPVYFEIFGALGYPDEVRMPLAVGTWRVLRREIS